MMLANRLNLQSISKSIVTVPQADFSAKMRKVRAKLLSKRKFKFYKLKTKKSVQKRFNVVGALRERAFSYHAVGHRHLNKNKSRRDLKRAKRPHFIQHMGDMKKLRCLLPYYRRRKALRS